MSITLTALMKQRYDTAANWTAQNPTLLAGEIGIESDTKKWKVGTGATAWTSLVYAIGGTYPIVNADIAAGAAIVDTKLATIATAGKVSNSATTAASANTASAIVARDASGNFTAGTITAALTGAASSNVLKAGDTMTGVLAVTAGTAALPGIAVSGDPNTGIYSPGADQVAISTGGTGRITVDASGNVNIDSNTLYVDAVNNRVGVGNSTGLGGTFGVSGNISLSGNGTSNRFLGLMNETSAYAGSYALQAGGGSSGFGGAIIMYGHSHATYPGSVYIGTSTGSGGNIILGTNNALDPASEKVRITSTGAFNFKGAGTAGVTQAVSFNGSAPVNSLVIDSSGRLLVGTSTARSFLGLVNQIQIESTDGATQSLSTTRNDLYGSFLSFVKSRSTSAGGVTVVQNGDQLGAVLFCGTDGSNVIQGARIDAAVDGTPGANDMPGRLVFSTTADGAGSPTERMRIDSTGLMTLAGPGIKFPATQVASADPNTLDDYEEGTWTPTQGTGVTAVGTFSSVGSYVKIGKQVSFAGYITAVTSVAFNPAGGNLAGGLPFSVLSGIGCAVAQNATGSVMIIAIPGGTVISGQSSVAATSVIYFSGTYPI